MFMEGAPVRNTNVQGIHNVAIWSYKKTALQLPWFSHRVLVPTNQLCKIWTKNMRPFAGFGAGRSKSANPRDLRDLADTFRKAGKKQPAEAKKAMKQTIRKLAAAMLPKEVCLSQEGGDGLSSDGESGHDRDKEEETKKPRGRSPREEKKNSKKARKKYDEEEEEDRKKEEKQTKEKAKKSNRGDSEELKVTPSKARELVCVRLFISDLIIVFDGGHSSTRPLQELRPNSSQQARPFILLPSGTQRSM